MVGARRAWMLWQMAFALGFLCRGEEVQDHVVAVSATVRRSPSAIVLQWTSGASPGMYQVYRKPPQGVAWGNPIANLPSPSTGFVDSNVIAGTEYEYRVTRSNPEVTGYGFVSAGIECPLVESRGTVLLLIDETHADELAFELERLEEDLIGDGWQVLRRTVSRHESPVRVRALIRKLAALNPNLRALLLLGHVPVPYSGNVAFDGHVEHQGAWPTDTFYADLDGTWPDRAVATTSAEHPANHNVPGDGKWDPAYLPSEVELEVGRVDLANLPVFASPANPDPKSEAALLRQYLDKNHAYRHKQIVLPARGLIDDHLGIGNRRDVFAASAWRAFAAFFQPSNVIAGDFLSNLNNTGAQFAYGAGAGGPSSAEGVAQTSDFFRYDIRAAFVLFFGSWFIDWDSENNFLRGALGTRTYTVAALSVGRPHWFLHPMAMGATVGQVTRLTQNNLNLYPGRRFERGVHIALMGDPTLRLHPVAPPTQLCVRARVGGGFDLQWQPAVEPVVGYHVYRAADTAGPFARLTASLVAQPSFSDPTSIPTAVYMVRAVKLESSAGGTYYNASQGCFAAVSDNSPLSLRPRITSDRQVELTFKRSACQNLLIESSTNLSHWTPLLRVTNGNARVVLREDQVPSGTQRFYRAQLF